MNFGKKLKDFYQHKFEFLNDSRKLFMS